MRDFSVGRIAPECFLRIVTEAVGGPPTAGLRCDILKLVTGQIDPMAFLHILRKARGEAARASGRPQQGSRTALKPFINKLRESCKETYLRSQAGTFKFILLGPGIHLRIA